MADHLSLTFGQPFAEQVAAFRLRLGDLVPTVAWDDIQRSAHDRAFMVAGATKADLLADLAAAVDKSISQGTSLEEFRRDFRKLVEKNGWHGWTGEGTRRGEAWRTRVIYKTNAATSYAAGRMAQLVEGKFPFWVYRHGGSLHPRLHHLAWNGLILPADHPFWVTHAPPNGWGCSCYILGARSMAAAKRLGGDPDLQLEDGWDAVDLDTGTPVGIGKGWDYAPGGTATGMILGLRDKLDRLPSGPSVGLIQEWLKSDAFAEWMQDPAGSWPLVRLLLEDARAIGSQRTVADLSSATMRKQFRRHPELSVADYKIAQDVVLSATLRIKDGPNSMIFVREASESHVLVVKATRSGQGLYVTSFRRLSRRLVIRDQELRRLLRKSE